MENTEVCCHYIKRQINCISLCQFSGSLERLQRVVQMRTVHWLGTKEGRRGLILLGFYFMCTYHLFGK